MPTEAKEFIEDRIEKEHQDRLDYTKTKLKMAEEENEKLKKENEELREQNQKLVILAFPEATKHFKNMVSSMAKTIRESGLNE